MKTSRLIACLFTLCSIACDSGLDSSHASSFAIYLLKDPNIVASQVWNSPLSDLVLAETPLLTQRDITIYRWQTHEFAVTKSVENQLAALRSKLGPVGGIPFVVTTGNDRIYLGAIWYSYSSLAPHVPYIDVIMEPHKICAPWAAPGQLDLRSDSRIRSALRAAGVLVE
jgi:hypothetical protein